MKESPVTVSCHSLLSQSPVKTREMIVIFNFFKKEFAQKTCTENGTWWVHPVHNTSWTNYNACFYSPIDISSHIEIADNLILLYTIGYSVSLASLLVAVVIMLYWRRLHCKSNTLHINLFIAFILRASMAFTKDRLFVGGLGLPQDVRRVEGGKLIFLDEGMHWECRTLFVLQMFAISASQTWMLMEGLYLYLLVHKTMVTERLGVKPYVALGWVLPWTFLTPWVIVKSIYENKFCWNIQENKAYFWIMKGPWTSIVIINFYFFLDIIRVLMTRVRNNQRHVGRSQYRKFGKFILVLIPLFGIMYIVLNFAFPSEVMPRDYNVIYLYIEMSYNSFQNRDAGNGELVGRGWGVEGEGSCPFSEQGPDKLNVVKISVWIGQPWGGWTLGAYRMTHLLNKPRLTIITKLQNLMTSFQVHSEIRRSWQKNRSRRYNSSLFNRSLNQSTCSRAHRSPGPSSPNLQATVSTNGKKKFGGSEKTRVKHSLSSQSTYLSSTAPYSDAGEISGVRSSCRSTNGLNHQCSNGATKDSACGQPRRKLQTLTTSHKSTLMSSNPVKYQTDLLSANGQAKSSRISLY
ncbi:Parathyroid hormone/parathyroid hormone- peptide receptor [Bulinus truncatus]|nr:Parathyroid hormone/parathyroid hormone- peptide receptor [Bulinus truncatus]